MQTAGPRHPVAHKKNDGQPGEIFHPSRAFALLLNQQNWLEVGKNRENGFQLDLTRAKRTVPMPAVGRCGPTRRVPMVPHILGHLGGRQTQQTPSHQVIVAAAAVAAGIKGLVTMP